MFVICSATLLWTSLYSLSKCSLCVLWGYVHWDGLKNEQMYLLWSYIRNAGHTVCIVKVCTDVATCVLYIHMYNVRSTLTQRGVCIRRKYGHSDLDTQCALGIGIAYRHCIYMYCTCTCMYWVRWIYICQDRIFCQGGTIVTQWVGLCNNIPRGWVWWDDVPPLVQANF